VAEEESQFREEVDHSEAELAYSVEDLEATSSVTERVGEAVSQASDRVQEKAGEVGRLIRDYAPDPAHQGIASPAAMTERRPLPVVVVAALLAGFFLGRRSGKKMRSRARS
jgi:hypothetical protein